MTSRQKIAFSRPRAYSTVLRLSSSFVTLCIAAKWCVLEQKLLLTAYRKSYMRNHYQNE